MNTSSNPPPSPAAASGPAPRAEINRLERELREASTTRPPAPQRLADALVAAIAVTRRWSEAGAVFYLPELLGDLSEVYEQLQRPDDALAVMIEAIEAGYRSAPDPRCRLAEIHLRAGHPEPAHEIFAQVKADTPDDVWLYNNAGLEYGAAGDHVRALEWLTEGLRRALDTGDVERLVSQLRDLRRQSLAALGHELDQLDARAGSFLSNPPPRPVSRLDRQAARTPPPGLTVPRAPAGADQPAAPPTEATSARRPGVGPRRTAAMAFSWFPATEFAAALTAWPELADNWGTSDHGEYCRTTEHHLSCFAEAQRAEATSGPLIIVPIRLDEFRAWCAASGKDPASGATRANYAADKVRTTDVTELLVWPPERNQRCWCGSARKYKQCCGNPTHTGPR